MGSADFHTYGMGATPREAFQRAVEQARYDHGHAGYTGTIAEKDDFALFTLPKGVTVGRVLRLIHDASAALYSTKDRSAPWYRKPNANEKAALVWFRKHFGASASQLIECYEDKWGPAVAFEVRGAERSRALIHLGHCTYDRDTREYRPRRTTKKVFAFMGFASC